MENQDLIEAARCGLAWVEFEREKRKRNETFHRLLETMCGDVIASEGHDYSFTIKQLINDIAALESGSSAKKVFGIFDQKLEMHIESIREFAVDNDYEFIPAIDMDKTGKANVAVFDARTTPKKGIISATQVPAGAIRYTFDEKHRLWRLFGFISGMPLRPVPLLIIALVILLFGLAYMALIAIFLMTVLMQPNVVNLLGLVASLFVGYLLFRRIRAYDRFTTTRIALAHDALASFSAPQAVVVMKLNGDAAPTLEVISASAQCPVCEGEVRLRKPNFSCSHEVIGACRNNPTEHCFTFDHTTRLGWPITETTRRHLEKIQYSGCGVIK
ncbi:hypothetical protein J6J08_05905 [Pseudidiomarina sp. 1APR75-33.1]|uniref:hypothetical protein n=1 Tax=Pseudidiomarina terrestris TaxID=2820060 RepID=UPI002653EB1E|nr:hypothetical protein [Pseudidiomarina sp. 1APR75-33.1]MDN7126908.1 hypothetical protein [Pseudidiomarina sp. 1APR75-33.1]